MNFNPQNSKNPKQSQKPQPKPQSAPKQPPRPPLRHSDNSNFETR